MQYIGWLANLLIVVGLYQVGYKYRHAFLWSIAGEAIWAVNGAMRGQWDLAVICVVFCAMAARNWWLWGRVGK